MTGVALAFAERQVKENFVHKNLEMCVNEKYREVNDAWIMYSTHQPFPCN